MSASFKGSWDSAARGFSVCVGLGFIESVPLERVLRPMGTMRHHAGLLHQHNSAWRVMNQCPPPFPPLLPLAVLTH